MEQKMEQKYLNSNSGVQDEINSSSSEEELRKPNRGYAAPRCAAETPPGFRPHEHGARNPCGEGYF